VTKGVFNFAQSIEDTVRDVIFSKMIPEQLDWTEFRAVGRQNFPGGGDECGIPTFQLNLRWQSFGQG
jgi:hypothetical protein